MNRKYFDMNSRDNWNDVHGNWYDMFTRGFDNTRVTSYGIKEGSPYKEFPPWLTLPVHYQEKKIYHQFHLSYQVSGDLDWCAFCKPSICLHTLVNNAIKQCPQCKRMYIIGELGGLDKQAISRD